MKLSCEDKMAIRFRHVHPTLFSVVVLFGSIQTPLMAQESERLPVTVTGSVADEATHSAIISKLRDLYGYDRIKDQTNVESVVVPPEWSASVQKLITPNLKQIRNGQLRVEGNTVILSGEVANDQIRQKIGVEMAGSLSSRYTVKNNLRVRASEQNVLDKALEDRIVEFESGSAQLTSVGMSILNELATVMGKMHGIKFEIVGHTDNSGNRQNNLVLSQARADSVKNYLLQKGIPADSMNTSGMGPDQPVASNNTDIGKRKNRRIEFRAITAPMQASR
jgi:OOP family OmpA-OmpF porin